MRERRARRKMIRKTARRRRSRHGNMSPVCSNEGSSCSLKADKASAFAMGFAAKRLDGNEVVTSLADYRFYEMGNVNE
jgi:hypothetical protein